MPAVLEAPKTTVPPDAQDAWGRLQQRIAGVRRRHRAKFLVLGLLLGLAAFAAAFLGFAFADIAFKLSVPSRVAWLALSLGGLAAVLVLATVRPWARLGGVVRTASEVEGAFPQLENQLSTTLEYGRDPALAASSSPELVGALIEQTHRRAEPYDFGRTVRWRAVAWAALAAFLVAAVVALYAGSSRRLFLSTWQRFIQPTAQIPAPTLTVIEKVEPAGDQQYPVESSVLVRVWLSGRLPETATLSVRSGTAPDKPWEDLVLERGEGGLYQMTLRRLLDTTQFKVLAGDAESPVCTLRVYREPQVDEFTVRLEYPKYLARPPETLPPGMGDVKALRGTQLRVTLKANTELAGAQAVFESAARAPVSAQVDGRTGQLSFALEKDDRYQLKIRDQAGHENVSPSSYRLRALTDARPRVEIRKPERDLMVHREQTVKLELHATDDYGVGEIGIFHSLGLDEKKMLVRRLDPDNPVASVEGRHTWELGPMGLKGGEVIAYYAYALDNDTLNGPKMAKSELSFLTVYDEEEYDQAQRPNQKSPPTPQAVKQLDKLIDIQKKLLQATFALARHREAAEPKPPEEREKKDSAKTAKDQRDLRGKLLELTESVRQELAQMPEEPPAEEKKEGEQPKQHALGTKELEHMDAAAAKMDQAAGKLDEIQPTGAVTPEVEALRRLSETRRLLLSDKEGDRRFKMAMNNQSKKKKDQQQSEQEKAEQQAREELAELPKMMEREKQAERDVERLKELKPRQPKPPEAAPPTPEEEQQKKDEQRKLKRQTEDALSELAKEAHESARKLENLAKNLETRPSAEKMQQAADKLQQAADATQKEQQDQAKDQAQQANRDMQAAQRNLRDAIEKQLRQELMNLQNDAQQLAQRQEDLAQASHEMQQNQPQQGQPQQGEQKQGQPQQGQQPQQGDQKQGQQPQQGEQKQGQPSAQSARMASLARNQGEIPEDLKDLASRLEQAAAKAGEKNSPSAKPLEQAKAQADQDAPASRAAQAAAQALAQGKPDQAEEEQRRAAKGLENVAQSIQEAVQKMEANDLKALGEALRKAQQLAREQEDVNKDLGGKAEPGKLAEKEQEVSSAAQELAGAAEKLEVLRRQGRAGNTKEQLERAAKQADHAAQALTRSDREKARDPAGKAEQALHAAVDQMERAAGKTLEEQAKQAQALAKEARQNQEKASAAAKELPEPKEKQAFTGEQAERRDEAASRERTAARQAGRMEKTIQGMEEMAKEVNPAAEQIAREARETSQEAKLPSAMEELAKDLERVGQPSRLPSNEKAERTPSPRESAARGEQLAQTVKQIEKQLEQFSAQANGDELSKLKALEQETRDAAKRAQDLAKAAKQPQPSGQPEDQGQPSAKPQPERKSQPNEKGQPREQGKPELKEAAAKLEKALQKLEPKMGNLEPNAPERKDVQQAQQALKEAQAQMASEDGKPTESKTPSGGPSLTRTHQHLEKASSGLVDRMERILRAREVKPDEDENAPKEYRALVDRYYRALSEDVEEERK